MPAHLSGGEGLHLLAVGSELSPQFPDRIRLTVEPVSGRDRARHDAVLSVCCADGAALGRAIDAWLRTLPQEDTALFLRRYWNGEALAALAKEFDETPNGLAQRMRRLRLRLKRALEEEGYTV